MAGGLKVPPSKDLKQGKQPLSITKVDLPTTFIDITSLNPASASEDPERHQSLTH